MEFGKPATTLDQQISLLRPRGMAIDDSKRREHGGQLGIVDYEIPFNRYFYDFQPPSSLDNSDAHLRGYTDCIKRMIEERSA